jgi:uncharacterized protein (TIGR03083 family)
VAVAAALPADSLPPILCAHLLRRTDEKLIELLGSLTASEWDLPTVAPQWKVRDVAAHMLDTALRKLSIVRDASQLETAPIRSSEDLLELVNRLNREGVAVYRRLSPRVLVDLMQKACQDSAAFHESLDPFAPAAFSVSWAGEAESLNWFDTARELTERWHHQQQIRLATNRPGIMTPELYHPVLDCFLRGLPYAFRSVPAADGTTLLIEITGDCGGRWYLAGQSSGWRLVSWAEPEFTARITIPQEIAWLCFTKGIDRESAHARIMIAGNRELGEKVLDLTAIVG